MPSTESPESGSSPSKKALLLFDSSTMVYWGSAYIYIPILAAYVEKVGGSLQAVGLVMSAYGLSQFLLRIPIGLLSDYLKRRKPFILLGFLLHLSASLGLAFSTNIASLFFSFFITGAASSMWVVFVVLFSSYFPIVQASQAMSIIFFFTRLSQMVTNYAGGLLAEYWGWTAPFYGGAVLAVLGFSIAFGIKDQRPPESADPIWKNLLAALRNSQLLQLTLICILLQIAQQSTVSGFTPIYALRIGASKEDLGILLFCFMLTATLISLLYGSFHRQYLKEKTILVGGFILLAIVTFSIPLTHQLWMLFVIQGLTGFGAGLIYPILTGLALKTAPDDQRATAMGFYHSLYAGGMALGPILAGLIGERWGLSAIFIFSGVFSCAGAILTWKKVKVSYPKTSDGR
jgi:DHA1 family multidrug resistance protein-like MFS transporter